MAIFIVVHSVFGWPAAQARATSQGYAACYWFAVMLSGLCIASLLAWAAYRIGRQSARAGTLVFSFALSLCILFSIARRLPSIASARPILENEEILLGQKRKTALGALAEAKNAANVRFDGIDQPGVIERRLGIVQSADAAVQEVLDSHDRAGDELLMRLEAAGYSPKQREQLLKEFTQYLHWDQGRPAYQSIHRLLAAATGTLQMLRDKRGHWAYDTKTSHFNFADQDLLAQYNAYQAEIRAYMQTRSSAAKQ